jgi:hypothetical protein
MAENPGDPRPDTAEGVAATLLSGWVGRVVRVGDTSGVLAQPGPHEFSVEGFGSLTTRGARFCEYTHNRPLTLRLTDNGGRELVVQLEG